MGDFKKTLGRKLIVLAVILFSLNLGFSITNFIQERKIRASQISLLENISENPIYVESDELEKIVTAQSSFNELWWKTIISQAVIGVVIALIVFSGQVLINNLYEDKIQTEVRNHIAAFDGEIKKQHDLVRLVSAVACSVEPMTWSSGDGKGIFRRISALNALASLRDLELDGVEEYTQSMIHQLAKDIMGKTCCILISDPHQSRYNELKDFTVDMSPVEEEVSRLENREIRSELLLMFRNLSKQTLDHYKANSSNVKYRGMAQLAENEGLDIEKIFQGHFDEAYTAFERIVKQD